MELTSSAQTQRVFAILACPAHESLRWAKLSLDEKPRSIKATSMLRVAFSVLLWEYGNRWGHRSSERVSNRANWAWMRNPSIKATSLLRFTINQNLQIV